FFSSRRRHTRSYGDWSSDVCSSDLLLLVAPLCPRVTYAQVARSALIGRNGVTCSFVIGREWGWRWGWKGFEGSDWKLPIGTLLRSEERRVGKECRCGWGRE